jgi:pimeloyl-ACP methyl ester carboxylesterase
MLEEMYEINYLASRRPEFALSLSTFMETTLRWRSPRPNVVLSEPELAGIRQPVHFIWGEADIFGAPSIGRAAAQLMPRATLEVRPGGHFPQLDDPEACGRSIVGFLSSQPQVAARHGAAADAAQRGPIEKR